MVCGMETIVPHKPHMVLLGLKKCYAWYVESEKHKENFAIKLLRKSEQYTKTDMVYLAHAGFWLTFARVVSGLAALLITVVLANILSKNDFGVYKYLISLAGIIGAFSLSGLGTAVAQSVAKGYDGILKTSFWYGLRFSIPMVVISFVGAGYYFYQGNEVFALALIIIGLTSPFIQQGLLWSPFLLGKKQYRAESFFALTHNLVSSIVVVTTAFLYPSVLSVITAYFVSNTLILLFLYKKADREYTTNEKTNEESFSFSKHLSLMGILGTLSLQADKLLVFQLLGAPALAIYTLALALPQQLRYGSKILATAALPKLAVQKLSILSNTLHRKALVTFAASLVIVVLYIAIAPFAFSILFPDYTDAIFPSQLFALVILFFPSTLYQQALTAHMKTKALYISNVVAPLTKIGFLLVLTPLYGMVGAIVSILIMETVRLVILLVIFRKIQTDGTAAIS
jgi:O-antigen/teichoic acid export membrane protein